MLSGPTDAERSKQLIEVIAPRNGTDPPTHNFQLSPSKAYRPASTTSSSVRNPGFGAFTSTAMLPGLCSFFHII